MPLLSTQEIIGDGTPQAIEYPSVLSPNAKIALIFDDFENDLTLVQGGDRGEVRIPADDQPFPYGPFRLNDPPESVTIDNADSVTISIHRI